MNDFDWIPEIRVSGSSYEAGQQLGAAWEEALRTEAANQEEGTPWWRHLPYVRLIEHYAPHLPDLYRGMAKGAGVSENQVATRIPMGKGLSGFDEPLSSGCTSFAVAGGATKENIPIAGQTKDISRARGRLFEVLALELKDTPHSALTLTYPGWLYGHGFVAGGCVIFRNSLYVDPPDKGMPQAVWGLLALHCPSVEEVMRLTRDHGVKSPMHVTVMDESGGIIGIEHGKAGTVFLKPDQGFYVHANAVVENATLLATEKDHTNFHREDSEIRRRILGEKLSAQSGRLTAPLCYASLMDHTGYPTSICRHQSESAMTCGVVIAEPTARRLHASRGPVCMHWPRVHWL
jgi:isopenicillin-N N-acyltransferase-like protein